MPAAPSTVRWNDQFQSFQDSLTGQNVGFYEAAERVRVAQTGPNDYRLQDATGRFVGAEQFGASDEFAWMSPNRGYIRFDREVEHHVIGERGPANINKVTRHTYYSGDEKLGSKVTSSGYGIEYSMADFNAQSEEINSGRKALASELGIDEDSIDRVQTSYREYEYRTPLR